MTPAGSAPVSTVRLDPAVEGEEIECAVAVFGSGIAGLSVACSLPPTTDVVVFSKSPYGDGSTPYAQGGIAAAIGDDDGTMLHATDTMVAAVGIADPVAVATLTDEAPMAIDFLVRHGADFDRHGRRLAQTLEGGHSRPRIVHAGGDATGAEISRALFDAAASQGVRVVNNAFLVDLLFLPDGSLGGALVLAGGRPRIVRCGAAVLASGGAGRLYAATTNPATCTGDGIAAAYRAGAELCDMEFVQFHPTALASSSDPRPLISEAVRGEGARLRDANGEFVMTGVHPLADLAPRDVVARRMVDVMLDEGVDHLYLDARAIADTMPSRFPTITATLARAGIDPSVDMIPVAPAAHYTIGGVRTSIDGATSVDGLYAAGEVASVGIHGANRLASNSLLEGVVFGRRIARVLGDRGPVPRDEPLMVATPVGDDVAIDRERIRRAMDRDVGVVRDANGLRRVAATGARRPARLAQAEVETANLALLAHVIAHAALERDESRGAHMRRDAPDRSPEWEVRHVVRRGPNGVEHARVALGATVDATAVP